MRPFGHLRFDAEHGTLECRLGFLRTWQLNITINMNDLITPLAAKRVTHSIDATRLYRNPCDIGVMANRVARNREFHELFQVREDSWILVRMCNCIQYPSSLFSDCAAMQRVRDIEGAVVDCTEREGA